ncbi:hypothetical protein ANCDUO_03603 [Ancylostoma duodenale]|uniref:Uncharacterized protein n=1 Tax=Ancylostoma duodenale TaxID=51022 RepID=A0A0C2H3G5_9BILA|nr:hypothetical protein ANCDUO_03603 [Ancylostoma duodenale]
MKKNCILLILIASNVKAECVNGEELPRTNSLKYLDTFIRDDASSTTELNAHINDHWMKFRATSGVLCDRKISDNLKSKIYRRVIRPTALYSSECWPVTEEIERRLGVTEAKMLRWESRVTRLDHFRNEDMGERYGVVHIQERCENSICAGSAICYASQTNQSRRSLTNLRFLERGLEEDRRSAGQTRCTKT